MITGVSRADLAIVLVDARHGIVEQTRRHTLIAALLRIPRLVVAVNKMDLVDYDEQRFTEIGDGFLGHAETLGIDPDAVAIIPISALAGANVVERSRLMPWYSGPALLEHLETVEIADARRRTGEVPGAVRHPTTASRAPRLYAATPARSPPGFCAPVTTVVVLPSGTATTVAGIDTADGPVDEAAQGRAVTVILADDVDVSRGDVIAATAGFPWRPRT